jgi:hypothetical protein
VPVLSVHRSLLKVAGYVWSLDGPVKIDHCPVRGWSVDAVGKLVSAEPNQPMVVPSSNPQTVGVQDLPPAMVQTWLAGPQPHTFEIQVSGAVHSALEQQPLFGMHAAPHILKPWEHA